MASPTIAANAYANLARVLENSGAGKGSEAPAQSFASLLKDAVGSVMESGRKSDAQTVAMAAGKANVMDVVTAVADTDVAVSTLVSVRDRVIAAYEDILKMPI
ncbi:MULTISPECIES: flagellar hook-basal body complex protein FliE [unclassified Bradyrhizobium]|jgi:flagellar hook-basal body complex protein FliE